MTLLTRRELLLSLPGLALARRALGQVAPIRVLGIHSVTLAVTDVERSLAFYQALFGAPVQARRGESVALRVGDGPMYLELEPAGYGQPGFSRWGLAVESFDADRVWEELSAHGLTLTRGGRGGASVGPERMYIQRSGELGRTRELYMGDLDGLVVHLQDSSHCGGDGLLGEECTRLEYAPPNAPLALRDVSHLTVNVPEPEESNAFYRRVFGMDVQAYQAASPLLGVGPGVHFLMFIGGNGLAQVNHACFSIDDFDVDRTIAALEAHGVRPREQGQSAPLLHWISMRMPNRGGAQEGTPELYFSDPDGISIQLQHVRYCGGGGYLGDMC